MLSKIINNLLKKPAMADVPKVHAPRPDYKRFNDAVLVVTQDNSHGQLTVNACNERAVKLIGYSEAEIISLDFRELLPPDIREIIEDNLEFRENGRGIDDVLQKISNFRLLGSRGREVPVKMRVLRGVSDSGHIAFRIIMNDTSLITILQDARKEYSILAGKESLTRDMNQIIKHGQTYGYISSFAIISFSDGNSHLKRAEKMIESAMRDTDIVGFLNDQNLVYIMPDTPAANAITPLLRFKNSLPADLQSRVIVRFTEINPSVAPAEQMMNCAEGRIGKQL